MNQIKEEPKKKESKSRVKTSVQSVLDGSFLTRDNVIGLLPYLLFLTFIAIIYIGNIYYAEKNIREMDDLKDELKELRYEYISRKNEVVRSSRQSAVARKLADKGIKEATNPPQHIKAVDNIEED